MSWPEIPEEPERVPQRAILITLAAVVASIGICVGAVFGGFADDHHASSERVHDLELSHPPSLPFSQLQSPAPELEGWTWADRDARRVRMPVNVAIDHYLAGER